MKNLSSVLVALCLGLMVGCTFATVNLQEEQNMLDAAASCCSSVSGLDYEKLAAGVVEFEIDQSSPVFEFESGRSYFKAFNVEGINEVEIRSFYKGFGIDKSVVFKPVLMELDENFERVSVIDEQLDNSCDSPRGCFLVVSYRPSDWARYLVIYTNPSYVGQIHKHEHTYEPGMYTPSGIQFGSGPEKVARWDVPFSPIGDFELTAN